LGQSGDGDEKIYVERIATDQDAYLRPQLEKLYPVLCQSELGEVPADLDLDFPSLAVPDDKDKAELGKSVTDTVMVALNGGLISPRTAAKELKQSSTKTGVFTNITDEELEALSDKPQSEGEVGEDLFGGAEEPGAGGGLNPAGSPAKVLKEEDRAGREEAEGDGEEPRPAGPAEDSYNPLIGKGYTPPPYPQGTIEHIQSSDGRRWAYSQYRKRSLWGGRYEVVDSWTLKERGPDGKVVTVATDRYKETAVAFVNGRTKATDSDGPQNATHFIHGLTVHVETPKGFGRHGKDSTGKPWRVTMPADYGYIEGHVGADGDSLDAYVGPDSAATFVYLIDQRRLPPANGFDETKCMLGFSSQAEALKAYDAGHHASRQVIMDFMPMTVEDFKAWLSDRDPKKPACVAGGVS
jgi:hypothetical protein